MRALRNCGGRGNPRFRITLGDRVFRQCPLSAIDETAWIILRRWRRMKMFGLPGMDVGKDMTEALAQAFELIESEMMNLEPGENSTLEIKQCPLT